MSTERVLVLNAGSSSLKYQLLQPDSGAVLAKGLVEQIGEPSGGRHRHTTDGKDHESTGGLIDMPAALVAVGAVFADHGPDLTANPPIAVGHRVVHGGTRFSATTRMTNERPDSVTIASSGTASALGFEPR